MERLKSIKMNIFSMMSNTTAPAIDMTNAPPLSIRNLTGNPVELKVVERFEAPGSDGRLADDAQSFARQDVSFRIEPFTKNDTDIKAAERAPSEVLRLTFESDGHSYRVDTLTGNVGSQELISLGGDGPSRSYTGVFLPRSSFLALYSSADLHCWMQHLPENLPLSSLSIPGTHNSPTYHKALPSVRCQAVPPKAQLENGVRFFDIRVQPDSPDDLSNDQLNLVHGVFPISLTGTKHFRQHVLDEVLSFLATNPSETVIMSLKREGPGAATDQHLSLLLRDHYVNAAPDRFWTLPHVPSLGEARGKVVLLRRFALDDSVRSSENEGRGWCLDAENWADNTPNDTHGCVCVQDFYEVLETENIEKKIGLCCDHFERAAAVCRPGDVAVQGGGAYQPLFLNFLSASNFWKVGCWPDKIAAKLNPAVLEFLCMKHDTEGDAAKGAGGVGIVICDWVGDNGDWDLVRCIVGMNARLGFN